MSNEIDQKIVEMRFDNKNFESNVQTSLSTLDKLKQSLKLDGTAKGLENIDEAAKRVNFTGISNAVETVKDRFSALEIIAVTALTNITNSIINAGRQMINSLAIEPITQGFSEYELKMDSIQTIMMGSGASLQEVNKYLNELNTYADKTIYSFSDMTSNIGKFINAGVNLKDSVKAIQGISNVAAISGANTNDASRAMYNFAQALSSGSVKLIDWKSIETANMATVEFKNELLKTALSLGTVIKKGDEYITTTTNAKGDISEAFNATSKFNDSLSHQWMTTEVLVKTLNNYSDETTEIGKKAFAAAQDVKTFTQLMDTLKEAVGSGWATSWEIVFGDFNEAKTLWTGINNVVGKFIDYQAEVRNTILQTWKTLHGYDYLIDALKNSYSGLNGILSIVKDAFDKVFPMPTATKMVVLITKFKQLSENFKMSNETVRNLKNTFKGLFSILDIGIQAFSAILRNMSPLIVLIGKMAEKILTITGSIGRLLVDVDKTIKRNKIFDLSIQIVIKSIENAINTLKDFFSILKEKLKLPSLDDLVESFRKFITTTANRELRNSLNTIANLLQTIIIKTKGVGNQSQNTSKNVKKNLDNIINPLKNSPLVRMLASLGIAIKKVGSHVVKTLGNVMNNISKVLDKLSGNDILMILNSASLGSITIALNNIIKGFKEPFDNLSDLFSGVSASVADVLDSVRGCFKAYQTQLNAGALIKIATAIGIISGSILVLSSIDGVQLKQAISAITMMFVELISSMAIFSKISNKTQGPFVKGMGSLIAMSVSILVLASALKKLSGLNADELAKGIAGVAGLMISLVASIKLLNKNQGTIIKGAGSIVVFSFAIKILASVCKDLAVLSWEEIAKGLAGVGVLISEVSMFINETKFQKGTVSTAMGVVILSSALKILSSVSKDFADMNWEEIAKGLAGVGVLISEVSMFLNNTKFQKKIISTSIGIVILSSALKILSSVSKDFALLSWDGIAKGLAGVGVLISEVSMFINETKFQKKTITNMVGLVILSASMKIFASVLNDIAKLNWDELGRGVFGLGSTMSAMTIILHALPEGLNAMEKGFALTIAMQSLLTLVDVFQKMAEVNWEDILKGVSSIGFSIGFLTLCVQKMPTNMAAIGAGLMAAANAMNVTGTALKKFGELSWEEIARGIVGFDVTLGTMTAALMLLGQKSLMGDAANAAKVAAVFVATAGSMVVLANALKTIGGLGWDGLAIALIGLAGAFVILGSAAAILGPIAPKIFSLSLSIASLGIGILGIGAGILGLGTGLFLAGLGLQELAVGLTSFCASLVPSSASIMAALGVMLSSMDSILIPLAQKIGVFLQELLSVLWQMIKDNLPEIREVIKTTLEFVFETIIDILDSSIEYIPQIIDKAFDLLIMVLNGIADRLPELIQAAINVLMAFFQGIVDAMQNIDTDTLLKGIEGIGLLSAIMLALAATAAITPAAMVGVLGMGAALAEFSVVLAAIGALKQIPGLKWFIDEGGEMLESVGTAIGKFIGGFIGGALEGITNQLPQIATNLSLFMENVQPFIEGASQIDADVMNGVKALAEVILLLTAADILNGLTSWITGGSSLSDFGEELAEFGPKMKEYADSVEGIDAEAIDASVNAAKALAGMANNLPKHGGVVAWFTGESSLSDFAKELEDFGPSIKKYSESVKGFEPEAVVASANAAKVLGEMADALPKHDGVVQWFTGESSLSVFAKELEDFGPSIKKYSESVKGFESDAVISSANAAKVLAEMANTLPKHGGMGGIVDWFTGDNSLSDFAKELEDFGPSMKNYSDSIKDFDPEAVMSSANAAKVLAEMKSTLPEQGGIVDWFTGDKSLSVFGEELKKFGPSIKSYADSISGMDTEVVTNSANAAKSLAEMATNIPDTGGLVSWFTGDNDLTTFGSNLVTFGDKFSSYSKFMETVNPNVVQATTNAADSLVELQKKLNEDNGNWFSGSTTIKDFGNDLSVFGVYFNQYYGSISTIKPDHLAKIIAETNDLVDMANGMNGIDTSGMSEFSAALGVIAQNGINNFISAFENAKDKAKKAAVDMISAVISAVEDKQTELDSTFDEITENPLSVIKTKLNKFLESGKDLISKIIEGMELKYTDTTKSMLKVVSGVKKKADDYADNFNMTGQTLMNSFKNGITSKASSIQNEVTVILNLSIANINLMYFGFYNAGAHLVTGLVLGIKSQTENAKKASEAMASESVKAIRTTLDEHSPSKVGDDLGENFAKPFVSAIKRHSDDSYEAGREVALSARSGLGSAISAIVDAVNSDMDYQPTIRPVVDLSDVTRSVESINSLFNAQKSIELASRTSMGINTRIIDAQAGLNINNADVLREMNNLREDVSMLSEAISRMKIVMDTGVLVGAIADPMDQELGTRYIYARRGN